MGSPQRWIVAGALVYAVVTVAAVGIMPPEGAPLHLDASGTPTRTGSRAELGVALLLLGAFMVAIGAGSVALVRRATTDWLSLPYHHHWSDPDRLPTARRMLARDVGLFMGATLAWLAVLPVWLLLAGRGALPGWLPWVTLGVYVLVAVAWGVHLGRVRYRPPPDPGTDLA